MSVTPDEIASEAARRVAAAADHPTLVAWAAEERYKEQLRRKIRRDLDAEERPKHEPLRALTVGELFAEPPPNYLVDQLLPQGALAELVGDSESLKSFWAIDLGLSVAANRDEFFGLRIVKDGPVLYIAAEGGGAFQYRVRAWGHEHGIDVTNVPFHTIKSPLNLLDPAFQEQVREIVLDVKPVLIIVDTLHRCIPGAEENSSKDIGTVVGFATKLQDESRAAVLFLHHPPKSDPAGRGRGSSALYYAADTEISAVVDGDTAPDGTKVVAFTVVKQKDDAKVSFKVKNVVVDVHDERGQALAHESGRALKSCVLRLATDEEVEAASRSGSGALVDKIAGFVWAHPGHTRDEIREAVKTSTKKCVAALDELMDAGRIRKVPRKDGRVTRDEYHVVEEVQQWQDPGM
jgi:hypothetical protein